jgi:ribokinase
MTEPEQNPHTAEPAEGAERPGTGEDGQTPHPQDPAEGADTGGGADTPDA